MFQAKEKVSPCTCLHHSLQLSFIFPLICSLWSPTGVALAQDNNHISVWSSLSSRQRDEFTSWGLQGPEYYFVRTNTWCSSLHWFTLSDWCWQFPQMKLCHSETWSMALISQILTSIRPQSNLFLPTTKHFWCRTARTHIYTHTQLQQKTHFYRKTSAASSIFLIPSGVQYAYLKKKKS